MKYSYKVTIECRVQDQSTQHVILVQLDDPSEPKAMEAALIRANELHFGEKSVIRCELITNDQFTNALNASTHIDSSLKQD